MGVANPLEAVLRDHQLRVVCSRASGEWQRCRSLPFSTELILDLSRDIGGMEWERLERPVEVLADNALELRIAHLGILVDRHDRGIELRENVFVAPKQEARTGAMDLDVAGPNQQAGALDGIEAGVWSLFVPIEESDIVVET